MYFVDRAEAGDKLADQLMNYRWENTAVLAVSPSGVLVAEQIARRLHCEVSLLLTARITAPGEESLVIGTLDQTGVFNYNSMISPGEMEEYMQDMRSHVEQEKMAKMYQMASVVGAGGLADPAQLAGRNIIIAADGVKNGMSFDAALHYLDRIPIERTIAAIPVGQAEVIERLHGLVDEMHYLYIPENFFSVSHYYEEPALKDPAEVIKHIDDVISRWI